MSGEITFGEFTLSSVVVILLGVAFEAAPSVPGQYKKMIAICFGIVLAMLGIIVQSGLWTAANVILHLVAGIMYGVQAIGTYHTINSEKKEQTGLTGSTGSEGQEKTKGAA